MALKKSIVDIQAADGLQQKTDVRRLPSGKSAMAVNLVKNKVGRLEKRLGFHPLNQFDSFGSGYSNTQGLQVGAWNGGQGDDLITLGRGNFNGGTVTAVQAYSDQLGGMVNKGVASELNVTADRPLAGSQGQAMSMQSVVFGNYLVEMWIEIPEGSYFTTGSLIGNVTWSAVELSSGVQVVPPTNIGLAQIFRVVTVGGKVVVCYSNSSSATIYCRTMSSITSGFGGATTLLTSVQGVSTYYPFDLAVATGDTTNFLIAYKGPAGGLDIVVEQRPASSPTTLTSQWVVKGTFDTVYAFAIRADNTSASNKQMVLAWAESTGGSFVINASSTSYTTFSGGSPTTVYTPADASEVYPLLLDVSFCGKTAGIFQSPMYIVSHSPWGACWNACFTYGKQFASGANGYLVGLLQTNPNRLTTLNDGTYTYFYPSNNARIIQNQFYTPTNTTISLPSATSGGGSASGNAILTPGVTLASRGLEVNGKVYYLGWVPSSTQGSFIVFCSDLAPIDTTSYSGSGNGYPMRPCGNVQVRTALCDPGFGFMANPHLYTNINNLNSTYGPNYWTGGSAWATTGDSYGTVYVSYMSSSQGQRQAPAYGAFQTTAWTGYSTDQWGTMTAISGALPSVYDGQNVFEQGFLWTIESVVATINTGVSGTWTYGWTNTSDQYTWILTWEHFDAQGNLHISARSDPITITGQDLVWAGLSLPVSAANITFTIPTLGATLRQYPNNISPGDFRGTTTAPSSGVSLGVYRTTNVGGTFAAFSQTYLRVNDRYFNGNDFASVGSDRSTFQHLPGLVYNTFQTTYNATPYNAQIGTLTFTDNVPDFMLADGTHPELYGDGTNGNPGSLDNFCPPASAIMVRHKERLFTANGNLVMFTKARGELQGPGYNEQVNAFFVGDDDPVTGLASMDDKLVIFKASQVFYISGDGPTDNGAQGSFSAPQPIPTDVGCESQQSIRSTPEGVYFMSTAGLRRVSRALVVEYVGGPVEDELTTYPIVTGSVMYPQNNRYLLFANSTSAPSGQQLLGEMLVRDYVLDAWTTAVLTDGTTQKGFISGVVANANNNGTLEPTLHLLTADGIVWREHFTTDSTPYYDNSTYVSSIWRPAILKQDDQGRFRVWDVLILGVSADPHGLIVSVGQNYATPGNSKTYTWGSFNTTPLSQLRYYYGAMGEAFQLQVQDIADPSSVTGQGFQVLGSTMSIGVMPGPFKLTPGATK